MSKDRRASFINSVVEAVKSVGEAQATQPVVPQEGTPSVLERRIESAQRIGERRTERVTLVHVAPERCRVWTGNARRYELLDQEQCQDLIASFETEGQKIPVILRPVTGDPDVEYEVVVGARRHWTAKYLGRPLLGQVDETLTDEKAFVQADLENRGRKDICDYERAVNYRDALERYYGGRQKALAAAIGVKEVWLSRYLDLADMPAPIVAAYPTIAEIRTAHMRLLKPLLNDKRTAELVMAAAAEAKGQVQNGTQLVKRLIDAAKRRKSTRTRKTELRTGTGKTLMKAQHGRGRLIVTVDLKAGAAEAEIMKGFRELLSWAKR